MAQKGFFVGLGGSYNSVYVQQDLYASGISNVYTSSNTLAAMGQASGDANPFNDTNSTLAPQIQ